MGDIVNFPQRDSTFGFIMKVCNQLKDGEIDELEAACILADYAYDLVLKKENLS